MDLKTIDRNIKAVKTNGAKWNLLVHTTAVAILEHALAHGDCTRALALVEAMPLSTKRASLIEWFAEYSPIGMNVKERKVRFHKPEAKLYNPFNIDKARDNPWFERDSAKKEDLPDTTLEEAHKKLFKLAAFFQKRLEEGEVANDDREAISGVVTDLKALATKQYRKAKAAVAAEGDKLVA
jgi:hypothetical protein